MLYYAAEKNCGERYTNGSGTIEYPIGNSSYRNNEYCVWHVQLPDSEDRIVVNVTEIDLGNDFFCDYDYLTVSIYSMYNIPEILLRTIKSRIKFWLESC